MENHTENKVENSVENTPLTENSVENSPPTENGVEKSPPAENKAEIPLASEDKENSPPNEDVDEQAQESVASKTSKFEQIREAQATDKPKPPLPPPIANGIKKAAENEKKGNLCQASVLDIVKYPEFSEAELNDLFKLFSKNAEPPNKHGIIDLPHMKQMLQALDLAQTHLEAKTTFEKYANGGNGLKLDGFMKMVIDLTAKNGKISLDVVLNLAAKGEVDVDDVGVGGAKRFFEAKAKMLEVGDAAYRAFEDKKRQEEEAKRRQEQFRERMAKFQEQKAQ